MVVEKSLKPPKDILDSSSREASRVDSLLRSKKVRLSPQQVEKIEKDIDKKYQTWKKNTNTLRKRLVRYNDMMSGVVEETNFPFEGASNITLHYAAGISRTFRSSFNRTNYQDPDIFVPILDPTLEVPEKEYKSLADGINHSFSVDANGIDILKEATIPCLRDGTVIVQGSWFRRVERSNDQRVYKTAQDFIKDYPDALSAGISEDEYKSVLDEFIMDPDAEVIVDFSHDFVAKDGIEYSIKSLAKFVFYPSFARKISDMEMYGSEYEVSESELKSKKRKGEFYEKGCDKVMRVRSNQEVSDWDRARAFVEGVGIPQDEYRPILLLDLVYRCDLDDDGVIEKYIVTYAPESKSLLSVQNYPIRRNIDICVAFRMISRENRFLGVSLVGDSEDLFNQIDVLHRHRNNVRMLTTSPVFIAQSKYKDVLDMGASANVIRPGLTLWVPDQTNLDSAIKQLPLQNLDATGNSMDEERELSRYVELIWGPTQGLSGAQTPGDTRAPARKTQMLLMQANQRIDDYIDEFDKSLPELARLHSALLFQYSPSQEISFDKGNKVFKFPLQMLSNSKISWRVKRRSVTLTPEFAMARLGGLQQLYIELRPLLMQGDRTAIEIWNRQVIASGEPESDKLIIEPDKAMELQRMSQAMALQNAERVIDLKAKQAGRTSMQKEVGKELGKRLSGTSEGQQILSPTGTI